MAVKESGGKWYVVKKDGSLGKRGFSTRASAEAAQARGRAMAGLAPSVSSESDEVSSVPGFATEEE